MISVAEQLPTCIEEGLELARIGVDSAKLDVKEYAREAGLAGNDFKEDIYYIEVFFHLAKLNYG